MGEQVWTVRTARARAVEGGHDDVQAPAACRPSHVRGLGKSPRSQLRACAAISVLSSLTVPASCCLPLWLLGLPQLRQQRLVLFRPCCQPTTDMLDSNAPLILTGLTGAATAGYMLADRADHRIGRSALKIVAATSFVALALANGALTSTYGAVLFAALVLSWLGDVALLWRAQVMFLTGLVAFLLGHLAFGVAFLARGVQTSWLGGGAVLMLIFLLTVGRWFVGKAPAKLQKPVIAYVIVITAMGSLAIGTAGSDGGPLIAVAAVAFMVSDIFVGLDRFVAAGWKTRRWGTPLYFGAQVMFAWSVS